MYQANVEVYQANAEVYQANAEVYQANAELYQDLLLFVTTQGAWKQGYQLSSPQYPRLYCKGAIHLNPLTTSWVSSALEK